MKKKIFEEYSLIFSLFIIGSFFGFVHENLLSLLKGQYVLRKGLIYEPLIPVYGIGLLAFYFIYRSLPLKGYNKIQQIILLFLFGFFLGGLTEYIFSYLQEKIFGTISWDYSYLKYNLHGRTSLWHSISWGLLGVIFYQFLLPILEKAQGYLKIKAINILIFSISVLFLVDCSISSFACLRQVKRRKGIEAINTFERLLDHYYPDEYLNKVYNNAMFPKK